MDWSPPRGSCELLIITGSLLTTVRTSGVFVNHADSVPSYLISTGTTDRIVNKVESGRENLERIVSL